MIYLLLAYYLTWFGIAYFAGREAYWSVIGIFVAFIFISFYLVKTVRMKELWITLLIAVLGFIIDILLFKFGVFHLFKNYFIWLFLIWIVFAFTYIKTFKMFSKIKNSTWFFLCAFGGPLSYYAAEAFSLLLYSRNIWLVILHAIWFGLYMSIIKKIAEVAL